MARTPRKMMMFRFWLDRLNARDYDAGTHLVLLRDAKDGRYTKTIRNGVRLIASLEQGRVDVLLELFPHIQALLLSHKLQDSYEVQPDQPYSLPLDQDEHALDI